MQYKLVRATTADRSRILQFMRQHFYKYEPLNVSVGLTSGPSCEEHIITLTTLHEGTSLMALDKETNKIVGIALNSDETPEKNDAELSEDLYKNCPCPRYAKVLKFLVWSAKCGHVWKNLDVDRTMDIMVLAVDSEKRRAGLGKALMEESMKIAKELGYPALGMHCSSHYSASLAEKLGMKCIHVMKYDEYLDENGQQVFQTTPPHVAFKSYVKILN